MALIPGFNTTLSGMKASQQQLNIISSNIANADTPGYTRKTAAQNNLVLAGVSSGVSLGNIQRNVDENLLKSYLSSNSTSGNYCKQNDYLTKVETLLGTPTGDNSIAANVGNLQAAFETFANDVTSASGKYTLLNNAQTITSRLNSISAEIQKLRGDADLNIADAVSEINADLKTLDELNDKIVQYTVMNYDGVADLEDQRDEVLRSISEKIDISYFKRDNGAIVIQTKSGETLLDDEPNYLSHTAISQAGPTTSYAGGEISGIFVNGKDITNSIQDGELKGLIEIRDVTLPSLQSQLDELAGGLKEAINAAHNMGTSYPAPSSLTGSRTFINANQQSIQIENGDVRFTIFDADGNQVATASLGGDLGFTEGTLADMTTAIQNWMRSPNGANLPQAVVEINENGNLVIDTGDSNYSFAIMDTASSAAGSEQQNVTINFAANGTTNYDRQFSGFSSFFGMNDFFTSQNPESVYDSKVVSKNLNLGLNQQVVLGFSSPSEGINFASITVNPGDNLQDIVNKINNNPDLNETVKASLVPNGDGYMLRIVNTTGEQLEISENRLNGDPAPGLLSKLSLQPSDALTASSIQVREDITENPNLIAGGVPEFNTSSGEYQLNPASNATAIKLAEMFSNTLNFSQAGIIGATQTTLANYAATFVGSIASQASTTESNMQYQQELCSSIATKEATISGVDIDQELSYMIMYQQSYAANAKAFTANKEILDMLMGII